MCVRGIEKNPLNINGNKNVLWHVRAHWEFVVSCSWFCYFWMLLIFSFRTRERTSSPKQTMLKCLFSTQLPGIWLHWCVTVFSTRVQWYVTLFSNQPPGIWVQWYVTVFSNQPPGIWMQWYVTVFCYLIVTTKYFLIIQQERSFICPVGQVSLDTYLSDSYFTCIVTPPKFPLNFDTKDS